MRNGFSSFLAQGCLPSTAHEYVLEKQIPSPACIILIVEGLYPGSPFGSPRHKLDLMFFATNRSRVNLLSFETMLFILF